MTKILELLIPHLGQFEVFEGWILEDVLLYPTTTEEAMRRLRDALLEAPSIGRTFRDVMEQVCFRLYDYTPKDLTFVYVDDRLIEYEEEMN